MENQKIKFDFVFLGAWNFKHEIFKKVNEFIKKGGKFIVPFPRFKLVK